MKFRTHKVCIVDDEDSIRNTSSRLARFAGTFASGETLLAEPPGDPQGCAVSNRTFRQKKLVNNFTRRQAFRASGWRRLR
jgi:FixJ family two-component response regulator